MNASRPLRLGLIVPPISGHLNPAVSLARELQERGHSVVAFGLPDASDRVAAAGIEFEAVGADLHPRGTVPAWMRRQGELTGLAGMQWILHCLQLDNLASMHELPAALGRRPVDALMIDQISYGAASVAQHQSLPYVTLCNALPVHLDRSVPSFATSWAPAPPLIEGLRSFLGALPLRPWFAHHLRPLNALRRAWNLPPLRPETLADSRLAVLSQQPAGFEFPRRRLPAHFHLTGPWFREDTRPAESFPYERLDGRPLIYASMGTLQNRIASVFRIIAEACASLPVQLVLALGTREASPLGDLPGSPVVVPFAPQLRLLRLASLVITHAGLNTALEALAHGVPMVAIPVTNDQPGVAARLRACGAGDCVPLHRLTVPRLRQAVERVLQTPSFRQNATRLAEAIARDDGCRKAATILETVLAAVPRFSGQAPRPSAARIAA